MIVHADLERPTETEIEVLSALPPVTLHEVTGQKGAMPGRIKPIYPGMRVCGPALTVDCKPSDNLATHAAVAAARPGDVLDVDYEGFAESGPFGDTLATACVARGVAGLAIDGCVRDGLAIRAMGFPVFARGLNMKGTTKVAPGAVGAPITYAGVAVTPGDAVVGGDNGVVVVPRSLAAAACRAAREREDRGASVRERLRAGAATVDLLNPRPLLGG